ncbi:uncharacterized protein M6B38_391470 [Iris pallida]|uniref:ASCH domain-containing protein n=1 Tax=Iris pallida TaxID=29817 RepID=A0AAX6FZW2_IRIPA|nr:uncharacterized protein M6B38_391470 [Iris pallida]
MRGGGRSGGGGGGGGRYRNPCLTMHQPWASLLVHGIKRIEGRSWPSPITDRLWIHAASKIPDPDTIKAMENFYREIYAVNGITDIKFPDHYPVSRLLGCVEVVGCLKSEELVSWEAVPESVRLEGLTDFCWLCERPQKLVVPFEMRGFQGVYNLEKRIYEGAVRGLRPVEGPQPVKFPLPDPRNPLSLKPGSVASHFSSSGVSAVERAPGVSAAIAGARAAATQFSKKDQTRNPVVTQISLIQNNDYEGTSHTNAESDRQLNQSPNHVEHKERGENSGHRNRNVGVGRDLNPQARMPSSKLFAAALKGLSLN